MSVGLLLFSLLVAHPDLDEGRVAISSMKYRNAVPALTRVTQDAAASEADVLEAYGLLAKAQVALHQPAFAQAAFSALLQRAPMTADPDGSPALRAAFTLAKTALFPPRTVRLTRRASGADALVVEVVNPWHVPLVASWQSVRPEGPPRGLAIEEHRVVTALAPGSAGWLELTCEGQVVAALGSRAAPLEGPAAPAVVTVTDAPKEMKEPVLTPVPAKDALLLPPPPPPAGNPSRRVLGWTLLGVGLAATAVGAGVLGWGVSDKATGDGFPFTTMDYEESLRLRASGGTKIIVGPVVGGVGLVSAITGVILLVTD